MRFFTAIVAGTATILPLITAYTDFHGQNYNLDARDNIPEGSHILAARESIDDELEALHVRAETLKVYRRSLDEDLYAWHLVRRTGSPKTGDKRKASQSPPKVAVDSGSSSEHDYMAGARSFQSRQREEREKEKARKQNVKERDRASKPYRKKASGSTPEYGGVATDWAQGKKGAPGSLGHLGKGGSRRD